MKRLKIIMSFLILMFAVNISCKRSIIDDEQNSDSNNVILSSNLNLDAETEEKMYPLNGQSGGVGSTGVGNAFRGFLYKDGDDSRWKVIAYLIHKQMDGKYVRIVNDLNIYIYWRENDCYKGIVLKKAKRFHYLVREMPFKEGHKAGYFHLLSNKYDIDFKIGFTINKNEVENRIIVNGQSTSAGDYKVVKVNRNNQLTAQVFCNNPMYFDVKLVGTAGNYRILNYYSPNGIIKIPVNILQKFKSGSFGMLYVGAHNVYMGKGFDVPIYYDGTKQVPMISVQLGKQVSIGATIKFY